jgi:hypothetical protein
VILRDCCFEIVDFVYGVKDGCFESFEQSQKQEKKFVRLRSATEFSTQMIRAIIGGKHLIQPLYKLVCGTNIFRPLRPRLTVVHLKSTTVISPACF